MTDAWKYVEVKIDSTPAEDWTVFEILGSQGSIAQGSLHLVGYLNLTKGGNPIPAGTELYFDEYAGIHSFFKNFVTATGAGKIENFDFYPRFARMLAETGVDREGMFAGTTSNMELRFGAKNLTAAALQDSQIAFTCKPFITANRTNKHIPFSQIGGVLSVGVNLESARKAFYGADHDATVDYTLTKFRLYYKVVQETPEQEKQALTWRVTKSQRSALHTNNANLGSIMPGNAYSMSSTFIKQSEDNSWTVNNLRTVRLPAEPSPKILFAFNDADNVRFGYPLDNREEILVNYQRSMTNAGLNSMTLRKLSKAGNEAEGWGIGVSFGQLRSLSQQKFDFNVVSDVVNTDPWFSYSYFQGLSKGGTRQ